MKSILFVCTGNIFRSLVAEYAMKARLVPDVGYVVGSAGTEGLPQALHPLISTSLRERGADPSTHVPRRLTRELLLGADLVVAMGLDHRHFIRHVYGRDVLLFNQICYQKEEPVLDVKEAIPNWRENLPAARDYTLSVIDYIWESMPLFLERVPEVLTGPKLWVKS